MVTGWLDKARTALDGPQRKRMNAIMAKIKVGIAAFAGHSQDGLVQLANRDDVALDWTHRLDGTPASQDMIKSAIARRDIDAVIVAAPPADALPVVMTALAEGRHVMSVEPVGTSVEDVIELRRAEAAAHGAVVKLGFPLRHHGSVCEARQIASSGDLGELIFIRATLGLAGLNSPGLTGCLHPAPADAPLLGPGLHMLDLIHLFAGPSQDIEAISTAPDWPSSPANANLQALLRTHGGTTSSLHISASQWRETFRVELGYEYGYLWLDGLRTPAMNLGPEMLISARLRRDDSGAPIANPEEAIRAFDQDIAERLAIQEFLDAIAGRTAVRNGTSAHVFDAMNDFQRICAAGLPVEDASPNAGDNAPFAEQTMANPAH